jgi:ABC-type antimicrobial peptide transport system permease subunit
MVRTDIEPRVVADDVRRALERATDGLPVTRVRTMREVASASIVRTRFDMLLMIVFGASATFLAALGIYGFISLMVKQGTRDIGIRMALGARARDIGATVLAHGAALTLIGVGVGLLSALGAARILASLLFGVTAHDPLVFAVVPIVLIGLALVSVSLPARRASRLDPAVTLRHE